MDNCNLYTFLFWCICCIYQKNQYRVSFSFWTDDKFTIPFGMCVQRYKKNRFVLTFSFGNNPGVGLMVCDVQCIPGGALFSRRVMKFSVGEFFFCIGAMKFSIGRMLVLHWCNDRRERAASVGYGMQPLRCRDDGDDYASAADSLLGVSPIWAALFSMYR